MFCRQSIIFHIQDIALIRRRHTRWFVLTRKNNLKAKSEIPLSDGVLIAIDDLGVACPERSRGAKLGLATCPPEADLSA